MVTTGHDVSVPWRKLRVHVYSQDLTYFTSDPAFALLAIDGTFYIDVRVTVERLHGLADLEVVFAVVSRPGRSLDSATSRM